MKKTNITLIALILCVAFQACKKKTVAPTSPPVDLNKIYPADKGGTGVFMSADLPTGDTIKSFSTTWTVPSTPTRDSTIFWWNGLAGGSLQPVLQWENGAWTIANWYFNDDHDGQGSTYHHGPFISVAPGTQLTGVITLVSHTATSFTYKESFLGYPLGDVTVIRSELAPSPCLCMEPYTNTYLAFPHDKLIKMTGINCVLTNGTHPPNLNWVAANANLLIPTPTGNPHYVVVNPSSSNGEVDIFMQ